MTIKNLSLAFYSAIFAAFFMKLADKFKMSFRGAEPVFHDCQPPYTAVHFTKTWKTSDGRIRCDAKSVVLGPELTTCEHRQKLYDNQLYRRIRVQPYILDIMGTSPGRSRR